ncbi:hypothetical protein BDQ17DRAFT_1334888 [Cyathus striatus]|nr:hypothetical protein BDQ17DRAFT_1334888 [Cyathus striatus]
MRMTRSAAHKLKPMVLPVPHFLFRTHDLTLKYRSTRNKSTNINATTTSGNTDNPPEPSNTRKHTISSTEGTTQPAKKKGKKESTVEEESEGNSAKKRKGKKGRGCKSATQHIAEDAKSENANEDTSAGENASNNPSDDSGSEIEEVSSKHNKSNEDTGNQTSKNTHNKDSEDTGN